MLRVALFPAQIRLIHATMTCGLTCTHLYISLSICCLTVVETRFTGNSQDLRIMHALYFLVLLIFGAWQFTECAGAACNDQNVGTVFCITTNYVQHQWATCLTNKYIQQQSRQAHHCDKRATHCYYQCMLETRQDQVLFKDYWKYV